MGVLGGMDSKEETINLKAIGESSDLEKAPENGIPERPTWGHKAEFILSCVGYTIGLGNVWRFPYLAYKSGGGAFIIPYCIMSVMAGVPLYIMEVALGQYFAEGPIGTWRIICPLTRGIGYAMMMVSLLVSIYYNVIIAWILFYLFASFRSDVPWRSCDPAWASKECREEYHISGNGSLYNATTDTVSCLAGFNPVFKNVTVSVGRNISVLAQCVSTVDISKRISPSDDYFNRYVLQKSPSINDLGKVSWQLALCLLLAWIVVYFCMCKGIQSAGKVVYFTAIFPYVVLFILLIRGLTLEGAGEGVLHYLKPNFTNMVKPEVWGDAGSQLFYSLGPGFGSLLSYGSYNQFTNNCIKDAMFLGFMDIFSSTLAGIVIFSLLGYMALKLGVSVDDVVQSGPGLAFVIYPEGVAKMPVSPLWSILFFFMLFTIGLDSQFGMMECVVTNMLDEYPKQLRKNEKLFILIVCILCYLVAIPMVCEGGIYIFNLFNWQSAGFSLVFVALVEIITVGWLFGTDRLNAMLAQMVGYKPALWWSICWKYLTPGVLIMIIVFAGLGWVGVSYDGVAYPAWAEFCGWLLVTLTVMWIPICAVKSIWEQEGSLFERLYVAITPKEEVLAEKAKLNGVTAVTRTSKFSKTGLV